MACTGVGRRLERGSVVVSRFSLELMADLSHLRPLGIGKIQAVKRSAMGSMLGFCGLAQPWRAVMVVSIASGAFLPVEAPLRAAESTDACSGTVLKLAVHEQAVSDVSGFRFSLALSGEGNSESVALQQLNNRLNQLRQDLKPLMQSRLEVTAPRSHQQQQQDFVAAIRLSGEVPPKNYDALIQLSGRLPGVKLQGMTSLASSSSTAVEEKRALQRALDRGQQHAQWMARGIGRASAALQQIDQRGAVARSLQSRGAAANLGFDPHEAPKPRVSVHLRLTYCLMD